MKRIILFLALLVTTGLSAHSVEDNLGNIYKALIDAIGEKHRTFPELIVLDREKNIAAYRKFDNKLILEKKALAICDRFGEKADAAVAFLIAHELTHFYRKHDWEGQTFFLADHSTLTTHIDEEREADTYGAFICYLANYEMTAILPELLQELYTEYNLKPELNGYPSLEERKKLGELVCQQVTDLIILYESANYFMAASYYEEAYYLYQYLLQFVKTKELFNNLGLANLAQALSVKKGERAFIYPIELDLETPFRKPFRQDLNSMLEESIVKFKKAIEFDRSYHTAYFNLTVALIAYDQIEEAKQLIQKLESVNLNKKRLGQMAILKGILSAKNNENKSAERYFKSAATHHRDLKYLTKTNLKVLKGKKIEQSPVAGPAKFEEKSMTANSEEGKTIVLDNGDPLFPVSAFVTIESGATIVSVNSGVQGCRVSIFRNMDHQTKRKIGVGSNEEALLESYIGETEKNLLGRNGRIIHFPEFAIAFLVDVNQVVKTWAVFD